MLTSFFGSFSSDIYFALCCIATNAFFVTCEFSLVKVRGSRMQQLAESGNKRAQLVSKMLEDIEGFLAATQFGITVTSLGLGWIGEPAIAVVVASYLPGIVNGSAVVAHTIALVVSFVLITFFQVVVGEIPIVFGEVQLDPFFTCRIEGGLGRLRTQQPKWQQQRMRQWLVRTIACMVGLNRLKVDAIAGSETDAMRRCPIVHVPADVVVPETKSSQERAGTIESTGGVDVVGK